MKLKRNYILFLCLFFVKVYDHAFAVACKHTLSNPIVQTIQSESSSEFDCSQNQDILLQYAIFSENDDDDSVPARKKPLISHFSALNTIFFLSNLSHSPRSSRRSYEHLVFLSHDRCIFQRVLKV